MKSIKKITKETTYGLRKEVLRNNIDLPYKFTGDSSKDTFHLGAFKDDKLVGVVSFMRSSSKLISGSQYQLRGMATLEDVRGEGFGNSLITHGVLMLKQKNIDFVWCNAREIALGFYKKNAFDIIDQPFMVEKIGVHYIMKRKIN